MKDHEPDFSLKHYFETLNSAKKKYAIGTLRDFPKLKKKEKFIILRHDVDVSLDYALAMARIENKYGLRSSYFILFHGEYYNPLSKTSVLKIKEIASMGHEIGLHYDSSFTKSKVGLMEQIKLEATLLEYIIDEKIKSICQHDLSMGSKINARTNKVFLDAMNPEILNSLTYISDSVQNWRHGCMCNYIHKENKLLILTHPIWWSSVNNPLVEIMNEYEKLRKIKLTKQIKQSIKVQKKYRKDIQSGRLE